MCFVSVIVASRSLISLIDFLRVFQKVADVQTPWITLYDEFKLSAVASSTSLTTQQIDSLREL